MSIPTHRILHCHSCDFTFDVGDIEEALPDTRIFYLNNDGTAAEITQIHCPNCEDFSNLAPVDEEYD